MRGTAKVRRDIPVFYDTYQALCAQGVQFPPFDPTLGPSFVEDKQSGDGPGVARSADPGFFFSFLCGQPTAAETQGKASRGAQTRGFFCACRGPGHEIKYKF
jgi:hypothetical protein